MIKTVGKATKNLFATIGCGLSALALYLAFQAGTHTLSDMEVAKLPVMAQVSVCDGPIDRSTGRCSGKLVTYAAFEQTGARCEGNDAIVSGTLSKVRADAVYQEGRQMVFFGSPAGRSRRAIWEPLDNTNDGPRNRPVGVQDWGPWRLRDGCNTRYSTWYTIVEHRPWHNLYNLRTVSDLQPLPRTSFNQAP